MAQTKPLGKICNGIDMEKCGYVLMRAVCNGKRTQTQVNAIAKEIKARVEIGTLPDEESTIVAACKSAGIGRAFAGV